MAYTKKQVQDMQERICLELGEGKSLLSITKGKDMASTFTVNKWLRDEKYSDFHNNYARARSEYADSVFESLTQLVDDCDGSTEAVAKARLQIDTRKWVLGRMKPKKYGDHKHIDLNGSLSVNNTIMSILGGDANTETED